MILRIRKYIGATPFFRPAVPPSGTVQDGPATEPLAQSHGLTLPSGGGFR